MSITEIEQAILDLPDSDFLKLRNWFLELDYKKISQENYSEFTNLLEVCDEIGKNAQAKGLTEDILTELLADES
ncbi:MAG: hypothetical protein IGQ45_08170 [Cyanobacterium sp. T60_A2020_053]|nr:hypothetical protein [Cyanobacterium sp. T60_A2020_053]